MTYAKKLTAAKILVSLGLCLYVLMSFTVNFGNLMALPIMLWAVWGTKLHGTGRSVRLMAFLGLAFTMGFYLAASSGHGDLTLGMDGSLVSTSAVFILLLSGVFLSIRRSSDAK
ncbi:MAG: hypothetical protein L3J05_02125 [Robiginitomaculum sp.]|nr:hypothetical protein [Robiginitomaculum sp.]